MEKDSLVGVHQPIKGLIKEIQLLTILSNFMKLHPIAEFFVLSIIFFKIKLPPTRPSAPAPLLRFYLYFYIRCDSCD